MATSRPARKLLLILAVIVLLPALFYSAYEINSLTINERLMAQVYSRQLDFILFSLNQYAWDIVSNWANTVTTPLEDQGEGPRPAAALARFLQRNPAVEAVMTSDTLGGNFNVLSRVDGTGLQLRMEHALRMHPEVLGRLNKYKQLEYRKIEGIVLSDSGAASDTLLFLFVVGSEPGRQRFGGMVVNGPVFVTNVLGPRLLSASGTEYAAAVVRENSDSIAYSTATVNPGDLKHRRNLWLFPGYSLGIATLGPTVEELVRSRFSFNLGLILLLDVILIGGAWMVYRNVRKEMDLVRLKSDFVSNVSHELRTPLALIRMFAETLEMGRVKNEEKRREYYSTIVNETERLTRLVNNILNFSRMEAGKKEYHFVPAELNDIAAEVLRTYAFHLQSEGVEPVIRLDPGIPRVQVDPEAVSEAVINLLDNALKYGGDAKFLAITTGKSEHGVFLEVEDHGIGIAREHQEKIFETFYRVSTGLVHTTKGSGLGLTLVKHIMDAHGGRVCVESTLGQGSRFRLVFPVAAPLL